MRITLKPVDRENWRQVVQLEVAESQTHFVAPNCISMLEAIIEGWEHSMAIYHGDTPVGYAMYEGRDGRSWAYICRLMIDHRFQGRGYGRTALQQIVAHLGQRPGVNEIVISVIPDNVRARALYERAGFVASGEMDGDEMIMRRQL